MTSQPADSEAQPSEVSPLLSQEIGDGVAPNGPLAGVEVQGNGTFPSNNDAEQQQGAAEDGQIHRGIPDGRKKMYTIFPALAIGVFLGSLDQTVIVSSYGKIGSDLHALNMTSWIATSYFLTTTSFQPLYGKLSDIFGRKPCLLFCYFVFGLGCLGCGLAQNMTQLIAARAFAGIGGGGMNVVVAVLMSDILPLRERGKWQGFTNLIFAAGSSTGGPMGGLVADSIGWRWIFLIQPPLCLVAIIAVYFVLDLPKKEEEEVQWTQKLQRIDFFGALALICTVFCLLIGLDRGSNVSWKTPTCYGPLIASAVSAIIFLIIEIKVAKEPFAPGHVIFNRSLIACYLCNFFSMAGALGALFYLPLYFQAVGHLSATASGVRMIPSAITGVIGSLGMGIYMQKSGKYFWITVFAYMILTCGLIVMLLCSGPVFNSIGVTIAGMCMVAFGNGGGITTTLIGLLANVDHENQAIAIACSYLFRSLGSVIGLSASSSVANQVLKDGLASRLPPLGLSEKQAIEIADKVRESLTYLRKLRPDLRAVVSNCYERGITAAFSLETGFALATLISSWFISEEPLSR